MTVLSIAIRAARAAAIACAFAGSAAADASPAFSPQTYERTQTALRAHQEIAARGGWPVVPRAALGAKPESQGPEVAALKARLVASGDLAGDHAATDIFDEALGAALARFQSRHGLSLTGSVGRLTMRALNTPISARIEALEATMARLRGSRFVFTSRYVVVNIPGASVEAVEDDRVARRYAAIVGRKDRQSPVLETKITAVNLNPVWYAPISIVKKDIAPKVQKDPAFLASSQMRVFAGGQEVDPSSVDWTTTGSLNVSVRQDPGPANALGQLRIDMPNAHAVFMHDTPKKDLFRSDVRFHSSGCARVQDVRDLAAWLLEGTEWSREKLDFAILSDERKDIRLTRSVPVAWVYMTGWADFDGNVQFRDDIYDLDGTKPAKTPVAKAPAARPEAPKVIVGAAAARPAGLQPSAWSVDAR